MSGEQITDNKYKDSLKINILDLNKPKKVNINNLLNKVRAEEKKEQLESNIFLGLIAVGILISGIIVSL